MYEIEEPLRSVEFRDGFHDIPAYIADLMAGLPTHTMTLEEANKKVNAALLERHIGAAYDQIIKQHFGGEPR